MSDQTIQDGIQQKYLQIVEALESSFTWRKVKRDAAIILRNMIAARPRCAFCGMGAGKWITLFRSLFKPDTWICDSCVTYVALCLTDPDNTTERKHQQWLLLKDLAP